VPHSARAPPFLQLLLAQLRDGHTLMLCGARAAADGGSPGQQQQQQQQQETDAAQDAPARAALEWDDAAPGAAAADLSSLPALLTTPALQAGLCCPLGDLRARLLPGAAAPAAAPPLAVVEAAVRAAAARPVRVHSACGRGVARVSLGFGCLLDDLEEEGGAAEAGSSGGGGGAAAGAAGHRGGGWQGEEAIDGNVPNPAAALWGCSFCGVECGGGETELAWAGTLTLVPAPHGCGDEGEAGAAAVAEQQQQQQAQGSEAAVVVAAEAPVWRALLPFSAEQLRRAPACGGGAAAAAARAAAGRVLRLCVVAGPGGELVATQAKALS
jgi:hypothetical protein